MHACLCTTCAPGVSEGQKMALDSLTLKLKIINMSYHVGVADETHVIWKSNQVLLNPETSFQAQVQMQISPPL